MAIFGFEISDFYGYSGAILLILLGLFIVQHYAANSYRIFIQSFILLIVGYALYPGYTRFNFDHLIVNRQRRAYSMRRMNGTETVPEDVYCLENKDAILSVLANEEMIDQMLYTMDVKDLPCIAPYYLRKSPEDFERVPNFIILNKRYHTPYRTMVTHARAELLYFLFNPQRAGGSLIPRADREVSKEVCEWPTITKEFSDLVVQVRAQVPVIDEGKFHIENTLLMFDGELAYCIQDYWSDFIDKNLKCLGKKR